MGAYSKAASVYDLLYQDKDYRAESEALAELIRQRNPSASRVLDVACGTGGHAEQLTALGFAVDGVDIEPLFIAQAIRRCPEASFRIGDMARLRMPSRYDAVLCLFSSIGYALTVPRLKRILKRMAAHLTPRGVLIVDPWFEPGELTHGWIGVKTGSSDVVSACRMQRTLVRKRVSTLEFEYLIGTAEGIQRRSERHRLGLFTQREVEEAYAEAGLRVKRLPKILRTRGLYVGSRADLPELPEDVTPDPRGPLT